MAQLPFSTGPVNASSATINASLLTSMGTTMLASSVNLIGTSALTLAGFGSNLINSSGSVAASAILYGNFMINFVATSGIQLTTSTSGLMFTNQILQASSVITTMLSQMQSGFQVSS